MIGALMLDIAGTTLTQEDIELLGAPQVGGVILFRSQYRISCPSPCFD